MFLHQNPRKEADYQYYVNCVDRFVKMLNSNENKLLVQLILYTPPDPKDIDNYNYYWLLDNLKYFSSKTNNVSLLFIIICPTNNKKQEINVKYDITSNNNSITIIQLKVLDSTDGLNFKEKSDNDLIKSIFNGITVQ